MRDGNPTSPRLTCKIGQKRPVGKLLQETKMEKKYWISVPWFWQLVWALLVLPMQRNVCLQNRVGMVEFEILMRIQT